MKKFDNGVIIIIHCISYHSLKYFSYLISFLRSLIIIVEPVLVIFIVICNLSYMHLVNYRAKSGNSFYCAILFINGNFPKFISESFSSMYYFPLMNGNFPLFRFKLELYLARARFFVKWIWFEFISRTESWNNVITNMNCRSLSR